MTTISTPGQITKAERGQLNRLIKMHFKTLRDEVTAEEQRALSEVDIKLSEHHRRNREVAVKFHHAADKVIAAANAKISALVQDHDEMFGPEGKWNKPSRVHEIRAYRRADDEQQLRRTFVGMIRSKATDARTQINRQENDRLRDVLVDALTTDAARGVLELLPTREQVYSLDLRALEIQQ